MKKTKKFLCVLLSVIILLSNFALFNTVYAQTSNDEPLTIEVTTDKSSYKAWDKAQITVKVTNSSNEAINDIKAEAIFEQLELVGKNNETYKEVSSLQPDESFSFSYKVTVNSNKVKLNFFEKMFLWFATLFNGNYTAENHNIEADIKNVTEIKFGKYVVENVVNVCYVANGNVGFTDEQLDEMEEVDTEISNILDSEEYENGDENLRKSKVENLLEKLENNGLIAENSIVYNEEYKQFYFLYNNGTEHYISIEKITDLQLTLESEETFFENADNYFSNILKNSSRKSKSSYEENNAIYTYGATDTQNPDYAIKYFNRVGLKTVFVESPTAEDYKTILSGYDMIIIHEHGAEFFNKEKSGLVISEKITRDKNKQYEYDLSNKRITKFNGEYCIRPEFFSYYYSNKLNDSFVQLLSCNSTGRNNFPVYDFDYYFKLCGASGTLGFHNSVIGAYAVDFMYWFTLGMFFGESSGGAFDIAREQAGKDEKEFVYNNLDRIDDDIDKTIDELEKKEKKGILAYPEITSYTSNPFNFGTFSISIKDKDMDTPIESATVKLFWIDRTTGNFSNHYEHSFDTNKLGIASGILPINHYRCEVSKDGYETHIINDVSILDNELTDLGVIELTKTGGSSDNENTASVNGTVIDEDSRENISNVKVSLYSESTKETLTTSTDSSGAFKFENLAAGNYTVSFEHEEYETNSPLSVELTDGLMYVFLDPIELIKKDSSGGGNNEDNNELVPDPNRTVIASGDCGDNGDNVKWILYEDGELVIGGTGAIKDFSSSPFYNYYSTIKTVSIGSGVTRIGYNTFTNCTYLSSITIPNSVTSIGNNPFENCHRLTNITVDINNETYSSDEYGVLFNKDKTTLIKYPEGNTRTDYIIPDSVIIIDDYSFKYSDNLISITIPDNVTSIGNFAFENCTSITIVSIPDSVTFIGRKAFYRCNNLTNISVGKNNQCYSSDKYGVLFNKDKTTLIQYPIGNSRTHYIIPDSVIIIDAFSFENCDNITSIEILDGVTSIGEGAFHACNYITSVKMGNNVITIGSSAFNACTNLTNIIIPDSVTSIGSSAFNYCISLASVTIGESVKKIGDSAFYHCNSLTSITIPNSVTSIGGWAFQSCSALTNITISNSVTQIQMSAFNYCTSLADVYYLGTVEQWNKISISSNNECLTNATIHYNS